MGTCHNEFSLKMMIVICIQAFAFQILIATCRSCQTLPPCLQQDRPTMWWCNIMKHFVNTKNFWPSLLFSSQTPLWTPLWKSSDPPQCPTWPMFIVASFFVLLPPCLLYKVVIWGDHQISIPSVWFHVSPFCLQTFWRLGGTQRTGGGCEGKFGTLWTPESRRHARGHPGWGH